MNDVREESSGEGGSSGGGRFHIVQPLRDPESNWAVDVAKNLEEYLLKICAGEVTGDEDGSLSVNFAEAALLLQGSVQVYSRKVEYLYSLVLHALDFISQKRQQDQAEQASVQPQGTDSIAVADEENEPFLDLNDVPVEAKNCLGIEHNKDDTLNQFVKPPANLVVLEGDCLDTNGDAGELESYLLATHDLYEDFILLDACDAEAIQNFLKGSKSDTWSNISRKGSSVRSKSRKSFLHSPTRRSGGSACKSSHREKENANLNNSTENFPNTEVNDDNDVWPDPVFPRDLYGDEINVGYSDPIDDYSDEDDPLKPLNPHEPGNLKVQPFKKVKIRTRQKISSTKLVSSASQFPVAKIHGTISPEFMEVWEARVQANERLRESLVKKKRLGESQSAPLYEKLRKSLTLEGSETYNGFSIPDDENVDNEYQDNLTQMDMSENIYMDAEPMDNVKNDDDGVCFGGAEFFTQDDPDSHENLEDLCRSHLDALLASIAETQKQTELATRVSTWKQRIENALEEQDSHPPFDIHEYGERVLDKLSMEVNNGGEMSFADVVSGQEKHDVARTFSALLQLVNNGNVDLCRRECCGNTVCYTAVNPFYVQLIHHDKRRKEVRHCSSKKRVKSPIARGGFQGGMDKPSGDKCPRVLPSSAGFTSLANSSRSNGKYSLRLGKVSAIRCTPEGKQRRRSNLVEPVDLHL